MHPGTDLSVAVRAAGDVGISYDTLRGPDWRSISRGLYGPASWQPTGLDEWSALRKVLPVDAAAGHLTSAALRGWWLPLLPPAVPLFATTAGTTHVQRRGVYVRRSPRVVVEDLGGLPVLSPESTVHELAGDLCLLDLVPILESAARMSGCHPERVLDRAPRRMRGITTLRDAALLADDRSESWFETMMRLLHLFAGFQVEPQRRIYSPAGVFAGRVDLLLVGTNRAPEYDGALHRDGERHRDDLRREKALRRAGVDRWGYTRQEIEQDPGRIVRDAEDALGLERDPRRLIGWRAEADLASISPDGRRRLAARIARYRRASMR